VNSGTVYAARDGKTGRAAETARAARPLGLLLAWLAGGRPQTVGSNPTAGRQSRSSKTGGASPQTLTGHFFSPSPFLTPQRVEATPTAAGASERWWRRHGSLAGARRSPSERAAVEMAMDGAHVLDPGRVPRRRRPATGFLCVRRRAVTRAVVLDRER